MILTLKNEFLQLLLCNTPMHIGPSHWKIARQKANVPSVAIRK